jgi:putative transposase
MAAYIDLNAVRAGLVSDPKDYRFCGYGEAVAGGAKAQAGLRTILAGETSPAWVGTQADYRITLFGVGSGARPGEGTVSPAELQKTVEAKGRLPRVSGLRGRCHRRRRRR